MELLEKMGAQVPSLGVLVVVVYLFLKSRSEERSEQIKSQDYAREQWLGTYRDMHKEHLDAREQQRVVLKSNAEALEAVAVAITGMQLKSHREPEGLTKRH